MEALPKEEKVSCITVDELDRLASKTLNGREIKNTTRTTQTLAKSLKRPLRYDLILEVLTIVEQFEEDFNGLSS